MHITSIRIDLVEMKYDKVDACLAQTRPVLSLRQPNQKIVS